MTPSERMANVVHNKEKAELAFEANNTPEKRKALDDALDVYVIYHVCNLSSTVVTRD